MRKLVILGALAGGVAWLASIGALDPAFWRDIVARERERLPAQLKEALEAGKRAAARQEERLDRDVQAAFAGERPPGV